MLSSLVTLYGDEDRPEYGFWATGAAMVAKIGARVGKGIAKAARARKALKRARKGITRAARAVSSDPAVLTSQNRQPSRVVPVTSNEMEAARAAAGRGGALPVAALAVAGVLALLVMSRK